MYSYDSHQSYGENDNLHVWLLSLQGISRYSFSNFTMILTAHIHISASRHHKGDTAASDRRLLG